MTCDASLNRCLRFDLAATDAKQRPGFQTRKPGIGFASVVLRFIAQSLRAPMLPVAHDFYTNANRVHEIVRH